MSPRRRRVFALCVALLVLLVGGGVWFATQSGHRSTASDGPVAVENPTTTNSEADKSLVPTDPEPTVMPAARVAPEVEAAIAATGETEVLVVFDAQASGTDDEMRAQVQAGIDSITASLPAGSWSVAGETPTDPVANLVIDANALAVLQQLPGIQRVQSALHEFFPAEVSSAELSPSELGIDANLDTMGASTPTVGAWASGFKGSGTTIAVLDTGVQTDHPFLMNGTVQKTVGEACFASNPTYTSPCPGGSMDPSEPSRVGAGAPCPIDIVTQGQKECIHGTHVAGIAVGGNGTGNSGIAPQASLISVQVFSYKYSTNRISANTGDIDDALQWLFNHRAEYPGLTAVNLSLGDGQLYTGFCDISEASTKSKVQQLLNVGIVTVVASGNESRTTGVSAPACLSNVVAVSALTGGSSADVRASYANIGPQVNVFAPGTLTSSVPCDGTLTMSGTSMATPAVSGSIAILRQASVGATVSLLEDSGGPVAGYNTPSVKLVDAIAGLPRAPGSVAGVASGTQIAMSWTAASPGSGSITSYTATALPGGQFCTTAGLSCTVTGLDPTKSYVVTVKATGTSGIGPGAPSAAIAMPNVAPVPTDYVPLVPTRLLDTRSVASGARTFDGNDLGCGAVGAGPANVRTLEVLGRGGVPTSGVAGVALNVTVQGPSVGSFLTVYPSGSARPNASNLNFAPGQTTANMVISQIGSNGSLAVYNNSGAANVIIDLVGWFPTGTGYSPMVPTRYVDTRVGPESQTFDGWYEGSTGPIFPEQTWSYIVAGRGSVPTSGVSAVALNVTVVGPTDGSFLTVFPAGSNRPTASNLNFVDGQVVPNMVIVGVGQGGSISLYNHRGLTNVVIDVVGWFASGPGYLPLVPERFLDSRPGFPTIDGLYSGSGPLVGGAVLELPVLGRIGIPSSGVRAVALNVTVTGPTLPGYLTVFPAGSPRPVASNVNFVAGETVPNMVICGIGQNGRISLFSPFGFTNVVVDVVGWFP